MEDIKNVVKGIEDFTSKMDKKYGKNTMMLLDDESVNRDVKFISAGCLSLDLALGGGYPEGRVIEIFGPESSGKTTLAIHAMVEAQADGGLVGFIDAEHAFDKSYAINLGLNCSKVMFSQPDNGEQALEMVNDMVESKKFKLIVVDSVAALTPKAEIEGDMGDSKMGLQARLMSQALRKLTAIISKTNTTVIFINQLRMKIGVMFGNPETTTGGEALKFYASQRLDVRKSTQVKDGEEVNGNLTKVKVIKNKVFPPFRTASFNIIYGVGIDRHQEIIDFAVSMDIVKKSGSWFAYGDTKIGQGIQSVIDTLRDNPELFEEIKGKVISKITE